jgi:hypothetical protein
MVDKLVTRSIVGPVECGITIVKDY